MRPSSDRKPKADITVTLLLHCDRGRGEDDGVSSDDQSEITLVHAGGITRPNDDMQSLIDDDSWVNYITRKGIGHVYKVKSPQLLEVNVGDLNSSHIPPLPQSISVVPCSLTWDRWPQDVNDASVKADLGDPIFTFVTGIVTFPVERSSSNVYICRLKFSTDQGMILNPGSGGEISYPAFGPGIVIEELWDRISTFDRKGVPAKAGHKYKVKLTQNTRETLVVKYELAFVGGDPDHEYVLDNGEKLCREGIQYLPQPIPDVREIGAPFWYLQPEDLKFRSKARSKPFPSVHLPQAENAGGELIWKQIQQSLAVLNAEISLITETINRSLERIEAIEGGKHGEGSN